MKTAICLFSVVVLLTTACAQKTADSKTPEAVRTAFAKLNPKASKVKWEKEEANYEANFKIGTAEQSMVFAAMEHSWKVKWRLPSMNCHLKHKSILLKSTKAAKLKKQLNLLMPRERFLLKPK
jgi:hypothetical protein